jgi:uncharacterized membrane protein YdbT with pleckstrin-like domain
MAYYSRVLRPEETVQFLGRLHWTVYARSLLLLGLAVVLALAYLLSPKGTGTSAALGGFALVALVLGLPTLLWAFLRRVSTEIVVTDRRVIYKTGLVGRRTVEMNVSKIETVDVLQGLLARLLGYGTVVIRGTGAGFEPLRRVAQPLELRSAILVG